jgi:hypothetical protein
MKNTKALLSLSLFTMLLLFSSFTLRPEPKQEAAIVNYAWYSPSGQFVAWSTLANAEIVSDADLNPENGTVVALGYTGGGFGLPPSGTLVYTLYSHP